MVTRRNDEQTVAGRHRMMRRADREVTDPRQVAAIIATCRIVNIAYTDAEGITIVPLNFGYVFDAESNHLTLYFHGSATGRKMDAVRATNNALPVAFEMATDCEVVEGRTLCNWGEAFKSIVGNGTASIIDDLDEARRGLALLMRQQAGMDHVEFTDQQVRAVTVWKVEADYLTAKVREKPQLHTH
ncbi:pyridoxamine 5'-phosphate oxidase family protein [Bifidobacterium catenulatum subsp. kashiwanohense]|uniref:pyridoxamine 5'-phosphate oxidase family protein n=1 Tax=Bifidobacterium catenulatum TaxID=1686 RepID=UPI003D036420